MVIYAYDNYSNETLEVGKSESLEQPARQVHYGSLEMVEATLEMDKLQIKKGRL